MLPPLTLTSSSSSFSAKSLVISSKVIAKSLVLQVSAKSLIVSSKVNAKSLVLQVSAKSLFALFTWVEARCCKVIDVSGVGGE